MAAVKSPAKAATASTDKGLQLATDLYVCQVEIKDLREQDVNANVMPPGMFDRLVENVKVRGALESLPYCCQCSATDGKIEIVSGHHRVRGARAAGNETIFIILDTKEYTRSQIVSKQLSHNSLSGSDDPDVLKQLAAMLDNPDDQLASGLPDDMFSKSDSKVDALNLFTPKIDFDYRTVSFSFLPHQQAELERLVELLDGRQDLVLVAPTEQFEELLVAASRYARFKKVLAGSVAITMMVRNALRELEEAEDEPAGQE